MSEAPDGIRIATLGEERLPDVLALLGECDLGARIDAAWLRYYTVGDPTCLPELLLVAKGGGAIVGFLLGCLRGSCGVAKLLCVAPRHRRRGIGSALFAAFEKRLAALGATEIVAGGVAPNYVLPGVPLDHTDAVAFLERLGYETDRRARIDMVVHLVRANLRTGEDILRLAREGIAVRRASADDVPIVAEMARATFSASWADEVTATARLDPPSLFLALDGGRDGGRVVSFAAYDVAGPARFGPTGTDPAYRTRGIGGVLLKECLRALRDRGEVVAEVSWAGPIGYYARCVGARIDRAYWNFRKEIAPGA